MIVPVNSLNQVIGAIPLLGDLLTGGPGGGLFAVSYRLSGTAGGAPVDVVSRSVPFERSVSRFIAAVRSGEPEIVFCAPADAVRTLAVAAAAEEALASGNTVPVETQ